MLRPRHIVFAGGATPSHLYPGLAVAAHVAQRMPDAIVTFVGSSRSLERHAVRAAGFSYANLPSQPEPQRPLHAVRFVTHNVAGYWASRWYLKEQRVSLVVGLGGSASAATVRAAMSRGIPTVMLEQNVVPGRVTRWLARSATMVCVGFRETVSYFPSAVPVVVTGNPARPAFERLYQLRFRRIAGDEGLPSRQAECLGTREKLDPNHPGSESNRDPVTEKRLIVIGGAGGARSINESMPKALARLRERLTGWQVVHQSGEGQLQDTARRYRDVGLDALVVAYIDEMAPIMFESDLVVCRCAGTTLAELALAGVPAVLVPYPPAMEYQMANADVFAAAGAARIIDETELVGPLDVELVEQLEPLIVDDARRQSMAARMRSFACPLAAANVTDAIHQILCGASSRLAA
jgi:UDP-N-acetylglucosamine--N-acetylmuramyl-(pentapeptide) pyrophosphoryl-undecaprenol N-acetylglucosamine transferase